MVQLLRFDAARIEQLNKLLRADDTTPFSLICRAHLVEEKLLRGGYGQVKEDRDNG